MDCFVVLVRVAVWEEMADVVVDGSDLVGIEQLIGLHLH